MIKDRTKIIHVRPATQLDDLAVGEILIQSFVQKYARKKPDFSVPENRKTELRAVDMHRRNGLVLVGEIENQVIGSVTLFKHGSLSSHSWDEHFSELRFLAVAPQYHGLGYGTPIMAAAEEECKNWGSHGIVIRVRKELEGLKKFYENRGFVRDPRGDQDLAPGLYLVGFQLKF